jgi:NDP-sugar pyrophosphorylase family protein
MRHIDWGLGVFAAEAFAGYPAGQRLDLAQVYQDLLAAGDLAGFEVARRFYEIGSPEGMRETDAYLQVKARSGGAGR